MLVLTRLAGVSPDSMEEELTENISLDTVADLVEWAHNHSWSNYLASRAKLDDTEKAPKGANVREEGHLGHDLFVPPDGCSNQGDVIVFTSERLVVGNLVPAVKMSSPDSSAGCSICCDGTYKVCLRCTVPPY